MKPQQIVIAIVAVFAVIAFGLIVQSAMDNGTGAFVALLIGVVLLCIVAAGLVAFGLRAYERVTKTKVEAMRAYDDHEYRMAKENLILARGRFIPRQQLLAIEPPQQQAQPQPADPRHELLMTLTRMTIRSSAYGPTSGKLMTADDAQEAGGVFADRAKWEDASKYGQEIGWLFTQRGGKQDEQGLKVKTCSDFDTPTAIDLYDALRRRNVVLDSAIAALPGVSR